MKRALGIFLALLVLCFALPAGAETERNDAEALRDALQSAARKRNADRVFSV